MDDSVDGITTYTYDALGQLLTETLNGTVVNTITYDNYGNIRTKNGVEYTYGDEKWKDLLTGVGDQSISYDSQGNPISYLGHTLTWEKGRQLKSFDNNIYTYNANGIRTSKTVDGIRHNYILDGVKILRETWNGNTLVPIYDNEDSVCGIFYNNQPYYFQKNLQGDIIGIVDKDSKVVAQYSYDAWGVPTITQDTTDCGIAQINPYRYRGYYFDIEIGMYYLQSRYYNPVVGRFVNGDEVIIFCFFDEISKKNLYSYCENCVVINIDAAGLASTKYDETNCENCFVINIDTKSSDIIKYDGIICMKRNNGFCVNMHYKFLLKTFCKKYGKYVVSTWGMNKKYQNMNATRIAVELFGHAVLFVLGHIIKTYSTWKLINSLKSKRYLSKLMGIVKSVLAGKVASFLINRSEEINVNNDEDWYRESIYWTIWAFFPPAIW